MPAEPRPSSQPQTWPKPRPLKAALHRGRLVLPEYLPARMLNEYVYCPRLFFYEWVEAVFAHSGDTLEGAFGHERVEEKRDELPAAEELSAEDRIHSRSVMLSSDAHGLIARIDLIEGTGGTVVPVDYKRGAPRDGEDGPRAWPADRAQVCAQALILRDNGYACDEAIVYYIARKQRVRVTIDTTLVEETIGAVHDARRTAESGLIPRPLIDSPKCPRCSLVTICLPDETVAAQAAVADKATERQLMLFEGPPPSEEESGVPEETRRLVPARDDLRPLYVTGHGLTIGKRGEVLQVRDRDGVIQEARLNDVSQVNVFGSVQVTAGAIEGLCRNEKPIAHFSFGGWFHGLTQGLSLKNVFLRQQQFRRADDEMFCLLVARSVVATKIRNQRTLLQRNHIEPPARTIEMLRRLAQAATSADGVDSLLGIEGTAARVYFEQFAGMIKVDEGGEAPAFDFQHRNRRPPRDPVNALLSLAYSLLARDLTVICHAVGFDPYVGFFHQPRFGRPALALDLMEGFRPLIADSVVLTAINTRMVRPRDFITTGRAVALTPAGRKGLLRAYEQRIDNLVTHPVFGYRVSYRRVLEVQTRLLARVVEGELSSYPGFETR
jgi:CRISPR-associated protein Cas1